ncbi:MAG: hypothetical protein ACP5NZ_00700 [Nanobdellota archaeon]
MSNKNIDLNKENIDEKFKKDNKYLLDLALGGAIGIAITGLNYYLSTHHGIDYLLNKPLLEMNFHELAHSGFSVLFGSLGVGGSSLYGIKYLMDVESNEYPVSEIKDIKIRNLEKDLGEED